MDIWVVAAAAGAGYLAKYWQKLREREGFTESFSGDSDGKSDSRPLLEQLRDKTCPIRRLGRRQLGGEVVSSSKDVVLSNSETRILEDGTYASEMASNCGIEFDDGVSVICGNSKDWNVLSLASLPPEFSGTRGNQENGDTTIKGSSGVGVRSKRLCGRSFKTLSSIDSCVTAQLCKEHVQMEDYLFSPYPSPSTSTVRPLLVTDRSCTISRSSSDSYREDCAYLESGLYKDNGLYSDGKGVGLGVLPLPEVNHLEHPKNRKQKKGKGRHGRLGNRKFSNEQLQSQGLPDGIFLLSLGITLGVVSTIIANKREVVKLNELLNQTQNFVQDLQEELEMKDSLAVQELVSEGSGSHQANHHIFPNQAPASLSSSREPNDSFKYVVKRPENLHLGENSESMSKIEAELEAELERLEMNMKASSLERRLAGIIEVDPDFVADVVPGELRADMVNGGVGGQADSDKDDTGTSTTPAQTNYAVSPQELSLRLHEVIQSRLEQRIVELENALENSHKRVQSMESRQMNFQRNYSNIDTESSSQESPTSGPSFLNLSGDAMDAYNEVCEEFMTIGKDEKSHPFFACKSNQIIEELHPPDQTAWSQNGGKENGSLLHLNIEDSDSRNLVYNKVSMWKERISSRESIEIGEADDRNDDHDDEFGRLLIKEIVEKARQGSPVVLNAQRMLFSMDEPHSE